MTAATEQTLEQPAGLLAFLRASPDNERHKAADHLHRLIADAGTLEPGKIQRGRRKLGNAAINACLLAYYEVMTVDTGGDVTGLARNVSEATFQLRELYDFTLRFDVARKLIAIYADRWPNARAMRITLPLIGDLKGPIDEFRDRKGVDVQIFRKPDADVTFVVFCGLGHNFGTPLNVLHHGCLAKHNTNVVYLRDLSGAMYLRGVKSLGDVDESCKELRRIFSELNTRRLIFLGNSAGAFASLYYGSLLGADSVLLFGGPTSLEIGAEEAERQVFTRVRALHAEGLVEWPDLREIYTHSSTSVSAYFASQHRVDRLQAENLEGLPNVELFPVKTSSHVVLDRLATTRRLDRILANAARPESAAAPRRIRRDAG